MYSSDLFVLNNSHPWVWLIHECITSEVACLAVQGKHCQCDNEVKSVSFDMLGD